jgi:hypothetical protein
MNLFRAGEAALVQHQEAPRCSGVILLPEELLQPARLHPGVGEEPRRPGRRGQDLHVVTGPCRGLLDGQKRCRLARSGPALQADDLIAAHDDLLVGLTPALAQRHVLRGRHRPWRVFGEWPLRPLPRPHPLDVLGLPAEPLLGLQALPGRLVQHDAGELPALLPRAHLLADGLEGRPP